MNSSYVNMGVGALLATLFVLKSVSLVSGGIFSSEVPEKPGFAIVADETSAGRRWRQGRRGSTGNSGRAASAEGGRKVEAIFKKCQACRDGTRGPNKVGPDLLGCCRASRRLA